MKNDKELYYELLPSSVPEILENDWDVSFKTAEEKEIAIRIFEWKYGPQDIFSSMSIDAWQNDTSIKFNKGYFKGKISFSLDREKVSIVKLMIAITKIILGDREDINTYIGGTLSLALVFQSAINVHSIKNDYHRCIYLKMIEISKNDPSIPIDLSKIKKLCNDDGSCYFSDVYNCLSFSKTEHSCLYKEEINKDDVIRNLEKMNVIRVDENNKNFAYIK